MASLLVCLAAGVGGVSMSHQDDPFAGLEQVQIDVAGTKTQADAQAIQAALLAHLKQSDAEDRDLLVQMTESALVRIDDEGVVRIGGWLLEARDSGLRLTYRIASGPHGFVAYVAVLSRVDGQWIVSKLGTEHVHAAR